MSGEERWCVVTGGRGFAARHLVDMLIRYEMFSVRIADLGPSVKLEPEEEKGILGQALLSGRAQYVSADLRDKSQVLRACQGAEVVFHMAAPDSSINSFELHHSVNVLGTQNVIDACAELNVKRLIYTSSASVVSDGIRGVFNGDESLPYPIKHNDSYSTTKAQGEVLIMKSNGINGLLTCCLRPSGIFGPGDKLLVPSLVENARAGKSKFIIGDGNNLYDFTYVENVAHAHICAERALASGGTAAERAAGEAYFITNMEPIKFWEFVSLILGGLGYERPRIKIPSFVIMPMAHMVEYAFKILAPHGMKVQQLTPSRIRLVSCSRTFSSNKANDRLGYTPIVTLQEGIKRTIDSYSHLRAELQPKKDGPSKASIFLGSGKVADILLWRNKRQTLTTMLILSVFYFNFILPGHTIITGISKLLLMVLIFLFIHGKLPDKILRYRIEKISESKFHFSEENSNRAVSSIASSWNSAANILASLCKGSDSTLFLKVALSLLILSFLGTISLQTFFTRVLPFAFFAFYFYEQKEDEIDGRLVRLLSLGCKLKADVARRLSPHKRSEKSE